MLNTFTDIQITNFTRDLSKKSLQISILEKSQEYFGVLQQFVSALDQMMFERSTKKSDYLAAQAINLHNLQSNQNLGGRMIFVIFCEKLVKDAFRTSHGAPPMETYSISQIAKCHLSNVRIKI